MITHTILNSRGCLQPFSHDLWSAYSAVLVLDRLIGTIELILAVEQGFQNALSQGPVSVSAGWCQYTTGGTSRHDLGPIHVGTRSKGIARNRLILLLGRLVLLFHIFLFDLFDICIFLFGRGLILRFLCHNNAIQ